MEELLYIVILEFFGCIISSQLNATNSEGFGLVKRMEIIHMFAWFPTGDYFVVTDKNG